MSVQLRFAAFSDVGLVRSNNQDSGYASPNLLVLADGMGGAAGGDIASSVTVGHLAAIDHDIYSADDLLPILREAITDAHEDLMDRAVEDPDLAGMGTTCIAVLRSSNKLAMVHIGDSRAYLLRDGRLTQVTHDHTLVQFLVDHGQLTPEEAETHPKRNVIMRALGDTSGEVELDESVREAVPGDRWLLCSDGLFGVVAHDTIEHTLAHNDITTAGESLIDLALAGGAPDNVTVVIAEVVSDSDSGNILLSQQPIVVGSAAIDYRRPTRGGSSAAARAAALNHPDPTPVLESDDADLPPSRFLAKFVASLAVLAILVGGVFLGYRWTQSQYYVSTAGGYVTVFQGIPQNLGPLHLSHSVEKTDLACDSLTPVARERLTTPITRGSLAEARDVVANLREQSVDGTPAVTAPGTVPDAGASPTSEPAATPSGTASMDGQKP